MDFKNIHFSTFTKEKSLIQTAWSYVTMTKDEYKVSPLAFPIFVGSVHILVGLTMTLFSEKMLISHRYIHGLMPNLIKKSWTVSSIYIRLHEW